MINVTVRECVNGWVITKKLPAGHSEDYIADDTQEIGDMLKAMQEKEKLKEEIQI